MTLGTSLIYWQGQEKQRDDVESALKALSTQFPEVADDEAILVMAHGTPHPANAYYAVIQDGINKMQLKNTFIYTVEGWPSLEDIIPELKAKGIKSVTLMPMMMVAGDHANNDMAGDSWSWREQGDSQPLRRACERVVGYARSQVRSLTHLLSIKERRSACRAAFLRQLWKQEIIGLAWPRFAGSPKYGRNSSSASRASSVRRPCCAAGRRGSRRKRRKRWGRSAVPS